jgi:hypothetical protein
MHPHPEWLHSLAWVSLGLSFLCAFVILLDELRKPQKMFIMNLVWPLTALYWSFVALRAYFKIGRNMAHQHQHQHQHQQRDKLSPSQVSLAVSHCGAGCALGDIVAEWLVASFAINFAGGAFRTRLVVDFLLAWLLGIVFQYFTIVPMRGLSPGQGIIAAMRADTLSILAFQIGMYAWMALVFFVLFPNPHLHPNQAVFWFMMQIGMIIGFLTSYPANVLLLRWGWKEKMG